VCLEPGTRSSAIWLGAYLRAATENPDPRSGLWHQRPRMMTLTYGAGVALAALAGQSRRAIYQVSR